MRPANSAATAAAATAVKATRSPSAACRRRHRSFTTHNATTPLAAQTAIWLPTTPEMCIRDRNYGYVVETEHYEYCLRCNPVQGDYQAYLSCYDLNEQKINHAYQSLVGRVRFINGDAQQFTDAKEYLDCIRKELPHEATSGFRFRTITQNPAVRKAVDDIVFDLYGEENPVSYTHLAYIRPPDVI